MRMSVNWACYIAWQHAENMAYEEANKTKEKEAIIGNQFLDELVKLSEQASNRGG